MNLLTRQSGIKRYATQKLEHMYVTISQEEIPMNYMRSTERNDFNMD
jgi:hypothetical protein